MLWTQEELEILLNIQKQNPKNKPILLSLLLKAFPYRSKWSILSKCKELKIKVTTIETQRKINYEAVKEIYDYLKIKKIK